MLGVHKHLVLLRHFVLTRNFLPREEKMGKKYLSREEEIPIKEGGRIGMAVQFRIWVASHSFRQLLSWS